MKRRSVLSSTHVDLHGMRMTRTALAKTAIESKGPRAISMGVEHDVMFPPIGKILNSYITPVWDGNFQLIGTQEFVETLGEVIMADGRVFVRQACPSDSRPFKIATESVSDKTVISVDPVNFERQNPEAAFFNRLDGDYESKYLLRKSLISDPEIVIRAAEGIALWFGSRKLLDETTKAIDQDIASFYKLVTRAVLQFAKSAIPKNRPKTYILPIPRTPNVEFVARTKNPQLVLTAINPSALKPHVEEAKGLVESFSAEKVQFVLQDDGNWKMSFMLTTSGEVIGDPYIIKRRDQVLRSMLGRRNATETRKV